MEWRTELRRLEPVDVAVALALTLAVQVETWAPDLAPAVGEVAGSRPLLSASGLLLTVPLAARRRFPLAVLVLVLGAGLVQQLATEPTEGLSTLAAMLVASHSVSAYGDRRQTVVGGAVVAGSSFGLGADLADGAFIVVVLGAAWAMGLAVGRRTRSMDRLELEHARAAQRGVAEERTRIARDLHDVVAHRVSMIVVQAQAADALVDDQPALARDAIRAIEGAGREALEELRTLLGVLHDDDVDGSRTPVVGLEGIEELVGGAGRAGVDVTLVRDGTPRAVPPAVGIAAYRVVQEAITNVAKHAGRGPATVLLGFGPHAVEVVVTSRGGTTPTSAPGYGLAGMAERVRSAGGDFDAGPGADGEFVVRATLPAPGAPS